VSKTNHCDGILRGENVLLGIFTSEMPFSAASISYRIFLSTGFRQKGLVEASLDLRVKYHRLEVNKQVHPMTFHIVKCEYSYFKLFTL